MTPPALSADTIRARLILMEPGDWRRFGPYSVRCGRRHTVNPSPGLLYYDLHEAGPKPRRRAPVAQWLDTGGLARFLAGDDR